MSSIGTENWNRIVRRRDFLGFRGRKQAVFSQVPPELDVQPDFYVVLVQGSATVDVVSDEALAMRRPRVRMTVRGQMVVVAIIAIVLGASLMKMRRDRCLQRSAYFSFLERKFMAREQSVAPGKMSPEDEARLNIFRAIKRKWEWAASHPWESVDPDLP